MFPQVHRLVPVLGLVLALCATSPLSLSAQTPAPAAPAPLTAADAAPLVGDWSIAADSQNGPLTFALTVKIEAGKPVAQISSAVMAATTITDMTKDGANVVLFFTFDYQGNAVPTVVTLTPAGDTLKALFDFASGAFMMPGTGTRKKAV